MKTYYHQKGNRKYQEHILVLKNGEHDGIYIKKLDNKFYYYERDYDRKSFWILPKTAKEISREKVEQILFLKALIV